VNDTRDRIVQAATELFRRQGLNGTSIKQITAAAGVTTGSLYHFYPAGKEQLAAEVIETSGAAYRDLFEMIADAAGDPVAAVHDFFEGAALALEDTDFIDPCPIGTIAREVASTSETLRETTTRVFDSWIAAAACRFERAGLPAAHAAELATCVVAAIEGGFVVARAARDADALRVVGRHTTRLVAASLLTDV
jgi:AcrR family transcriptional regulator